MLEDKRPRREIESIADYQKDVSDRIEQLPGMLVVHSVGSGKTRTAIYAAESLLRKKIITHVIVVSPKTLLDNFKNEMSKHGIRSGNRYYYIGDDKFVSYAENDIELQLQDALVIFDEIHTLRNDNTQKYPLLKNYVKGAKKIIGLTATPIVHKEDDIINELRIVTRQPLTLNSDLSQYISFYERNLDSNDYPSYTIHEVSVSAAAKINWMVDTIRKRPNDRFILYSRFTESGGTSVISSKLNEANIKHVIITGAEADTVRFAAQKAYNAGDVKVIIISTAGAYGLNLKKTRGLVVLESVDSPAKLVQIIGRAVRFESHTGLPKSEHHVDVFLLEDGKEREAYKDKVWDKMATINNFYRRLWPGSVGIKLNRRNYNKKRILANRLNRGNNIMSVLRNSNLPRNVVNRANKLSPEKREASRARLKQMILL